MKYTKKDIKIGCSFKRSHTEHRRLVCVRVTDRTVYFKETITNNFDDYPIDTVLSHINNSKDIDFQKEQIQHYEIY